MPKVYSGELPQVVIQGNDLVARFPVRVGILVRGDDSFDWPVEKFPLEAERLKQVALSRAILYFEDPLGEFSATSESMLKSRCNRLEAFCKSLISFDKSWISNLRVSTAMFNFSSSCGNVEVEGILYEPRNA